METDLNAIRLQAIQAAATAALKKFPGSAGLIQQAAAWVESGALHMDDPHADHAIIEGVKVTAKSCPCPDHDSPDATPDGICVHQFAFMLQRRALEHFNRLSQPSPRASVARNGGEPPTQDTAHSHGNLPPQFVGERRNQKTGEVTEFVRFPGLLFLAHEAGLVSLVSQWTFNNDQLSLATATVVLASGLTVTDGGDATPENVPAPVKPAWRRMALTRAEGRALSRALNVPYLLLEELGDS